MYHNLSPTAGFPVDQQGVNPIKSIGHPVVGRGPNLCDTACRPNLEYRIDEQRSRLTHIQALQSDQQILAVDSICVNHQLAVRRHPILESHADCPVLTVEGGRPAD